MGTLGILAAMCIGRSTMTEFEHGWRTDRVIATRYKNESIGEYVRFTFPKNPYDCDRTEIGDFMGSHGGWPFEMGGNLGAPVNVVFEGVTDRESADAKIRQILPALDKLMRDIANGVPIPQPPKRKVTDKVGKEWPECIPPDPNDPYGRFNNNLNVNGVQYLCSPEGRWIVDEEAGTRLREYERRQLDLLAALSHRKLTHEELMRVTPHLNVFNMQSYYAAVKYAELYDLLITQWELQTGTTLPIKTHLSGALGEYNRAPQEEDNKRAVEELIRTLQTLSATAKANE